MDQKQIMKPLRPKTPILREEVNIGHKDIQDMTIGSSQANTALIRGNSREHDIKNLQKRLLKGSINQLSS